MSTVSEPQDLRNLSSGPVVFRWESEPVPVTVAQAKASPISMSAAAILPPSGPEEAQGFASFSTDGNAFGVPSSQRENKPVWGRTPYDANDTYRPVILGSSWPALSETAKVYVKHSFNGSYSGGLGYASSAQGKFGDGVGFSDSFSCNVGPSSFSFTSSVDLQPVWGNYSNMNHCPWDSQSWGDQVDRQRKYFGKNHRASYGSRHYEHRGGSEWNSYRHFNVRDPQMLHGHLRLPLMRPIMPDMNPNVAPLPPFPHFYRPVIYPDFPPQMHILPTHPHAEYFRGHHFNPPPAPPQIQSSMHFSWHEQKRILILKQVEYYFSSDNLCKDVYLRSHMDNHGWVLIHLIAGFKRMKLLTDNISFICDALNSSRAVEVEGSKVRKRDGWNIWVLSRSNSHNNTESETKSQRTEEQQCLVSQMEKIALVENVQRISDS